MEPHAVRLVEIPHKPADLRTQHALHRLVLGRHDIDVNSSRAKRGRHLEADEARSYYHCALRRRSARNNRLAVAQRSKVMYVRLIRSGDAKSNRLRAGR